MVRDERNPALMPDTLRDLILFEMPCGLCVARRDERGSLLYANESFCRMFGYHCEEESETEGILDLFSRTEERGRLALEKTLALLLSGAEHSAVLETRLSRYDGGVFWAMVHIRSVNGDEPILICAFTDISAQKIVEEELRFREEEYRVAVRQSDKLVFRYDIAKREAYLPPEFAEIFQADVVRNVPKSIERAGIVDADSVETLHELHATIRSGAVPTGSAILRLKIGRDAAAFEWYRVTYSLIYREDQTPAQAVLSLQNISEQHEREIAYKRWEQTYAAMSKNKTAFLEFDLTQNRLELQKGELIDRFPPLEEQTMENAMRYFVENWVHPEDREKIRNCSARDRLLATYFSGVAPEKIEYRHLRGNGRFDWVRFSIQMLPDPYSSNVRAFLLLRDIDARKREELALQDRLRTDPLTGALNRTTFTAQAEAVFADRGSAGKHALVILDVDRFKQINDCFGHGFGDRVLIRVSETLRTALRADDLVGRLGGDEFLLLLKNVSHREALLGKLDHLREKIFQRVSEEKTVSCSFGAAVFPCDGTEFEELYRKTDIALYEAKNAGRNCVRIYDESMNPPITLFETEGV